MTFQDKQLEWNRKMYKLRGVKMDSTLFTLLLDADEPYAAGLFENPDANREIRYARAQQLFWERAELPEYDGGMLYPNGNYSGPGKYAVYPFYPYTFNLNTVLLHEKCPEAEYEVLQEYRRVPFIPQVHTVGGHGWVHSHINFPRILKEGLCTYRKRVEALPADDFKTAMLLVLDGIHMYKQRLVQKLKESDAPCKLISALDHAEEAPGNFYEAIVLYNFVYYVDTCDDIGRPDTNLYPYWNGEDATELFREFFTHVDYNAAWSGALGPETNELTIQIINAIHHIRRPNLQLRLKKDTPDDVWDAVYGSLGSSCGQPSFYNEELYQKQLLLKCPEVSSEDRERLVFGGCTETMIEGMSNVGSDDAGLNTAHIYDRFTRNHLADFSDFTSYYKAFCETCRREIDLMLETNNLFRRARALYRPQPVRTLLIDDCIDNRKDFNAGGARYYWSVSNIAGFVNVVDSLCVVRELVFEKKLYTADAFHEALDRRDADFLRLARNCPCFGVADPKCDELAADFANVIYDSFEGKECYPCGKFFPVSNQFTTYESAGWNVLATPDGRDAVEPLCDSLGAVHAKDTKGPTALLTSTASLPLYKVLGTPIMNLRMKKEHLPTMLRPLVEAFFEKGGMQLQISVLSREEMLDAQVHPENHQNLIVRIGGFSEYFVRLSPKLQETVLKRTEY